ncbi:MAG: DUF6883 domain-containing protein [Chloroflexota bacterium]
MALEAEAVEEKTTDYGISYQVEGMLQGINDRELGVTLVWFRRLADNRFYFVTLKPRQGGTDED